MKNIRITWLIAILVAWVLVGISAHAGRAAGEQPFMANKLGQRNSEASQTTLTTQADTPVVTETPAERVLPPVGGNAGLVLGASVLVIIILAGVMLFSKRKTKH